MLSARSVAVVGASPREGSFGHRLVTEVRRSPSTPELFLVNPRHTEVLGAPCVPSLDAIEDPVDLVLLGVPDSALETELTRAAARGARGAVVFGTAYEPPSPERPRLGARLAEIARAADMALCGGGCMGFANVSEGLRAMGYLEREPLPAGPIALVTHSGSAFSALLRTHRRLGYTLAVSSGQELVTTTADYVEAALDDPATRVVALLMETLRSADRLRAALDRAARQGVAVVLLTVGGSEVGRGMVAAHSGAVAGADAAWEALVDAHGLLRVRDLDEMTDTLELLAVGRRATSPGLATVHDSGAERTLVADIADEEGVAFAALGEQTVSRLDALLEPGLVATNPLDVWGTGADTLPLFAGCLRAVADDPAVGVVALAVDLVEEYDGDESYPLAVLEAAAATDKPVAVLSNVTSALDQAAAARLRSAGVPVLEGTRSGLRAVRHLLQHSLQAARTTPLVSVSAARQERWRARLGGPTGSLDCFALLRDYGIPTVGVATAASREEAVRAAAGLGWPVVLKTDEPGVAHKSDVGGVVLGLAEEAPLGRAYDDLAERLGPRVLVAATAPAGVELALGLVRDPLLGPLVVVAAGGVLVELLADRAVGLPPLDEDGALRLLDRLTARPLLDGLRGAAPADLSSVVACVRGLSQLAVELGDLIVALDVNPLIAGPTGAVAVDVLVVPQ